MRTLTLFFLSSLSLFGFSQTASIRTKHFNLKTQVAIQGYDPIAYFKENKAVKGSNTTSATYLGVTYYFSSIKNKDLFIANPTSYEPQYGGWCAYAMGQKGEKVEIDPSTFKIINGKLYLFYNAYFNNTLTDWNKDQANLKNKADKNWLNLFR